MEQNNQTASSSGKLWRGGMLLVTVLVILWSVANYRQTMFGILCLVPVMIVLGSSFTGEGLKERSNWEGKYSWFIGMVALVFIVILAMKSQGRDIYVSIFTALFRSEMQWSGGTLYKFACATVAGICFGSLLSVDTNHYRLWLWMMLGLFLFTWSGALMVDIPTPGWFADMVQSTGVVSYSHTDAVIFGSADSTSVDSTQLLFPKNSEQFSPAVEHSFDFMSRWGRAIFASIVVAVLLVVFLRGSGNVAWSRNWIWVPVPLLIFFLSAWIVGRMQQNEKWYNQIQEWGEDQTLAALTIIICSVIGIGIFRIRGRQNNES